MADEYDPLDEPRGRRYDGEDYPVLPNAKDSTLNKYVRSNFSSATARRIARRKLEQGMASYSNAKHTPATYTSYKDTPPEGSAVRTPPSYTSYIDEMAAEAAATSKAAPLSDASRTEILNLTRQRQPKIDMRPKKGRLGAAVGIGARDLLQGFYGLATIAGFDTSKLTAENNAAIEDEFSRMDVESSENMLREWSDLGSEGVLRNPSSILVQGARQLPMFTALVVAPLIVGKMAGAGAGASVMAAAAGTAGRRVLSTAAEKAAQRAAAEVILSGGTAQEATAAAAAAASRTTGMATAGGAAMASEATIISGTTMASIQQTILDMPLKVIETSPEYKRLLAEHDNNDQEARLAMVQSIENKATSLGAGAVSAVLGGIATRYIAGVLMPKPGTKIGVGGRTARTAISEGSAEAGQNPLEEAASNLPFQSIDGRPLVRDPVESMASGFGLGATISAPLGLAGSSGSAPTPTPAPATPTGTPPAGTPPAGTPPAGPQANTASQAAAVAAVNAAMQQRQAMGTGTPPPAAPPGAPPAGPPAGPATAATVAATKPTAKTSAEMQQAEKVAKDIAVMRASMNVMAKTYADAATTAEKRAETQRMYQATADKLKDTLFTANTLFTAIKDAGGTPPVIDMAAPEPLVEVPPVAVPPTTPEPVADVVAQLAALKTMGRGVVGFAEGTQMPELDADAYSVAMPTAEGGGFTFVAYSPEDTAFLKEFSWQFHQTRGTAQPLTTAEIGALLYGADMPTKDTSVPDDRQFAIQTTDATGNPYKTVVVTDAQFKQGMAAARKLIPPGGSWKVVKPADVLQARVEGLQKEAKEAADLAAKDAEATTQEDAELAAKPVAKSEVGKKLPDAVGDEVEKQKRKDEVVALAQTQTGAIAPVGTPPEQQTEAQLRARLAQLEAERATPPPTTVGEQLKQTAAAKPTVGANLKEQRKQKRAAADAVAAEKKVLDENDQQIGAALENVVTSQKAEQAQAKLDKSAEQFPAKNEGASGKKPVLTLKKGKKKVEPPNEAGDSTTELKGMREPTPTEVHAATLLVNRAAYELEKEKKEKEKRAEQPPAVRIVEAYKAFVTKAEEDTAEQERKAAPSQKGDKARIKVTRDRTTGTHLSAPVVLKRAFRRLHRSAVAQGMLSRAVEAPETGAGSEQFGTWLKSFVEALDTRPDMVSAITNSINARNYEEAVARLDRLGDVLSGISDDSFSVLSTPREPIENQFQHGTHDVFNLANAPRAEYGKPKGVRVEDWADAVYRMNRVVNYLWERFLTSHGITMEDFVTYAKSNTKEPTEATLALGEKIRMGLSEKDFKRISDLREDAVRKSKNIYSYGGNPSSAGLIREAFDALNAFSAALLNSKAMAQVRAVDARRMEAIKKRTKSITDAMGKNPAMNLIQRLALLPPEDGRPQMRALHARQLSAFRNIIAAEDLPTLQVAGQALAKLWLEMGVDAQSTNHFVANVLGNRHEFAEVENEDEKLQFAIDQTTNAINEIVEDRLSGAPSLEDDLLDDVEASATVDDAQIVGETTEEEPVGVELEKSTDADDTRYGELGRLMLEAGISPEMFREEPESKELKEKLLKEMDLIYYSLLRKFHPGSLRLPHTAFRSKKPTGVALNTPWRPVDKTQAERELAESKRKDADALAQRQAAEKAKYRAATAQHDAIVAAHLLNPLPPMAPRPTLDLGKVDVTSKTADPNGLGLTEAERAAYTSQMVGDTLTVNLISALRSALAPDQLAKFDALMRDIISKTRYALKSQTDQWNRQIPENRMFRPDGTRVWPGDMPYDLEKSVAALTNLVNDFNVLLPTSMRYRATFTASGKAPMFFATHNDATKYMEEHNIAPSAYLVVPTNMAGYVRDFALDMRSAMVKHTGLGDQLLALDRAYNEDTLDAETAAQWPEAVRAMQRWVEQSKLFTTGETLTSDEVAAISRAPVAGHLLNRIQHRNITMRNVLNSMGFLINDPFLRNVIDRVLDTGADARVIFVTAKDMAKIHPGEPLSAGFARRRQDRTGAAYTQENVIYVVGDVGTIANLQYQNKLRRRASGRFDARPEDELAVYAGIMRAFLHESVHAATMAVLDQLRANNPSVADLQPVYASLKQLYEQFKAAHETRARIFQEQTGQPALTPYGFTHFDEFLAEFGSNQRFFDYVYDLSTESTTKPYQLTLFQRLINRLRNLIGLPNAYATARPRREPLASDTKVSVDWDELNRQVMLLYRPTSELAIATRFNQSTRPPNWRRSRHIGWGVKDTTTSMSVPNYGTVLPGLPGPREIWRSRREGGKTYWARAQTPEEYARELTADDSTPFEAYSPQQAAAAVSKATKDVNEVFGLMDKLQRGHLGIADVNVIEERYRKLGDKLDALLKIGYNPLTRIYNAITRTSRLAREIVDQHTALGKRMSDLSTDTRAMLYELMTVATFAQVHVDSPLASPRNDHLFDKNGNFVDPNRVADITEAIALYNHLQATSPEAVALYKEYRDLLQRERLTRLGVLAKHAAQSSGVSYAEAMEIFKYFRTQGASVGHVRMPAFIKSLPNTNQLPADAIDSLIDLMKRLQDINPLEGPYFPLRRSGRFVVVTTDAGQRVESEYDNLYDARQSVEALQAQGRTTNISVKVGTVGTQLSTNMLSWVEEMKTTMKPPPNATAAEMKTFHDIQRQVYASAVEMLGSQTLYAAQLKRGYVRGVESKEMGTALSEYSSASIGAISAIDSAFDYNEALNALRLGAKTPTLQGTQPGDLTEEEQLTLGNIHNEFVVRAAKSATDRNTTAVDRTLGAIGFFTFLGAPSYWIQNGLQVVTVGIPKLMGAANTSMPAATAAVSRAYKKLRLLTKGGGWLVMQDIQALANKLPPNERDILLQLQDDNAIQSTMAHEVGRLVRLDGPLSTGKLGKFVGPVYNNVTELLQTVPDQLERINRVVMAFAAMELKITDYGQIRDVVNGSQFNYDPANRGRFLKVLPEFFGGGGRQFITPIMMFKTYGFNLANQLYGSFYDAYVKGASTPEEKERAKRVFYGLLATHTAVGGLKGGLGLGLAQVILATVNAFLDDEDKLKPGEYLDRFIADHTNDYVSRIVMMGAPAAIGINMSNSNSLGNLIVQSRDVRLNEYGGVEQAVYGMLGPVAQYFATSTREVARLAAGESSVARVLEELVPLKMYSALSKSVREGVEGMETRQGQIYMRPEEVNIWDSLVTGIGLQSAAKSQRQERFYNAREYETAVYDSKSRLLKRRYEATTSDERQEVDAEIDQWNEKMRELKNFSLIITSKTIKSSDKTRKARQRELDEGRLSKVN